MDLFSGTKGFDYQLRPSSNLHNLNVTPGSGFNLIKPAESAELIHMYIERNLKNMAARWMVSYRTSEMDSLILRPLLWGPKKDDKTPASFNPTFNVDTLRKMTIKYSLFGQALRETRSRDMEMILNKLTFHRMNEISTFLTTSATGKSMSETFSTIINSSIGERKLQNFSEVDKEGAEPKYYEKPMMSMSSHTDKPIYESMPELMYIGVGTIGEWNPLIRLIDRQRTIHADVGLSYANLTTLITTLMAESDKATKSQSIETLFSSNLFKLFVFFIIFDQIMNMEWSNLKEGSNEGNPIALGQRFADVAQYLSFMDSTLTFSSMLYETHLSLRRFNLLPLVDVHLKDDQRRQFAELTDRYQRITKRTDILNINDLLTKMYSQLNIDPSNVIYTNELELMGYSAAKDYKANEFLHKQVSGKKFYKTALDSKEYRMNPATAHDMITNNVKEWKQLNTKLAAMEAQLEFTSQYYAESKCKPINKDIFIVADSSLMLTEIKPRFNSIFDVGYYRFGVSRFASDGSEKLDDAVGGILNYDKLLNDDIASITHFPAIEMTPDSRSEEAMVNTSVPSCYLTGEYARGEAIGRHGSLSRWASRLRCSEVSVADEIGAEFRSRTSVELSQCVFSMLGNYMVMSADPSFLYGIITRSNNDYDVIRQMTAVNNSADSRTVIDNNIKHPTFVVKAFKVDDTDDKFTLTYYDKPISDAATLDAFLTDQSCKSLSDFVASNFIAGKKTNELGLAIPKYLFWLTLSDDSPLSIWSLPAYAQNQINKFCLKNTDYNILFERSITTYAHESTVESLYNQLILNPIDFVPKLDHIVKLVKDKDVGYFLTPIAPQILVYETYYKNLDVTTDDAGFNDSAMNSKDKFKEVTSVARWTDILYPLAHSKMIIRPRSVADANMSYLCPIDSKRFRTVIYPRARLLSLSEDQINSQVGPILDADVARFDAAKFKSNIANRTAVKTNIYDESGNVNNQVPSLTSSDPGNLTAANNISVIKNIADDLTKENKNNSILK